MSSDSAIHDIAEVQLRQACAELQRRLWAGEPACAEEFFAAFPALASQADFAAELIYTEFTAREELGQRPCPEEWYDRFPQWWQRLQRLFQVHALMEESLEGGVPTTWGSPASQDQAPRPKPPSGVRRLGHYELLEEVGRGGMGVVYKARDANLDRLVALKLILAGAHAGPEDLARFRTEAEAAARLQHPHIVQIYEVGESPDGPYFAMEFVAGGSLAQRCTGKPQPPLQLAQLVEALSRAMHYAHQRRVVHRDLKPANVLLVGGPDTSVGQCVPKITDFGLAKRLERESGQTRLGSIIGTPSYMAPEQASGEVQRIGPPADIYALGAILYQTLTGRPPFGTEMSLQTLAQVVSEEPVPPTRLQPSVPRDLETICLKCLQKEPHKRYADAQALADDLRRFLAGEPIQARPVGVWERGVKWARRRPAIAALIAVSVVAVFGMLAGSLWYNARLQAALGRSKELQAETDRQAQLLREELDYSRRSVYALQLAQVETIWERDPIRGLELLEDAERCPPDLRDFTWGYFYRLCKRDRLILREHAQPVLCVAFSPGGELLAAATGDDRPPARPGEVKLWNAATGQLRATLIGHTGPVYAVVFTPDGKKLATASGDRWQKVPGEVKLWDTTTFAELSTIRGHDRQITSVTFGPDGKTLATASADKTAKLWDVMTGQELATFWGHTDTVTAVAFSRDGRTLATASADKTVRLWDVVTAEALATLRGHAGAVTSLAFSRDGQVLATGGVDRLVIVWDATTGSQRTILKGHTNRVLSVAFAPGSKTLVTGSYDFTVKVWDVATGKETTTLKAHISRVASVAFAPDGKMFASGSADHTVKVWDLLPGTPATPLTGHQAKVLALAFSPDGAALASGSMDQTARLWDGASGELRATLRGHTGPVRSVSFSPDGRTLATGSEDQTVKLWDLAARTERLTLTGHAPHVTCVVFSPGGKMLATCGLDETVKIWDPVAGLLQRTLSVPLSRSKTLAFSPDGATLACGTHDNTVKLWDTSTWQEHATLKGHTEQIRSVAFAPTGKTLATGSSDSTVKIWDLATFTERCTLRGHTHYVYSVTFSPDGKTLASGTGDRWINAPGEVKLWDGITGQVQATLQGQGGPVAFSPNGKSLVTTDPHGAVKLWNAIID